MRSVGQYHSLELAAVNTRDPVWSRYSPLVTLMEVEEAR
jgi:hypothetical protein